MERSKRSILKHPHEKVTCCTIHVLVFMVYFFELLVILPRIYGNGYSSTGKVCHVVAGTFILFNMLASYWKFLLTDPGIGTSLPSSLSLGWFYCWVCEANVPPRSFHCNQCATCVLVRDHHCAFNSNCLGYKTRRYFLLMNIYFWVALLYANIMNMDWAYEVYHNFTLTTLVVMFLPGVAWLFGLAEQETFFMMMVTTLCLLFFIYATSILYFHMRNTLQGITTHEYKYKKGQEYNLGIWKNIEHAFGTNWKFGWISPLISSPLPGDGITFERRTVQTAPINTKVL